MNLKNRYHIFTIGGKDAGLCGTSKTFEGAQAFARKHWNDVKNRGAVKIVVSDKGQKK
jgi:hypothetical protein